MVPPMNPLLSITSVSPSHRPFDHPIQVSAGGGVFVFMLMVRWALAGKGNREGAGDERRGERPLPFRFRRAFAVAPAPSLARKNSLPSASSYFPPATRLAPPREPYPRTVSSSPILSVSFVMPLRI